MTASIQPTASIRMLCRCTRMGPVTLLRWVDETAYINDLWIVPNRSIKPKSYNKSRCHELEWGQQHWYVSVPKAVDGLRLI